MKKRRLLQSGKLVSEIGLGCMSFAGFYGPTDEKEAHDTLKTALDCGYVHQIGTGRMTE